MKNNHVLTPPLSANILPGITRQLVIELLNQHNIMVTERMIAATELIDADEIWLTGSVSEIVPVIMLDQRPVNDGKVGILYKKAAEWYKNNVEKHYA